MKIKPWLKEIDDNGLFGWRTSYILLRPHKLIEEICLRIKWAWQRVFRGWDDRVVWSVDMWLGEIMPPILTRLMESKQGTPIIFYEGMEADKYGHHSEEQSKQARHLYELELQKMIVAFTLAKDVLDNPPFEDSEYEKIMELFSKGMESFTKYFFTLWD